MSRAPHSNLLTFKIQIRDIGIQLVLSISILHEEFKIQAQSSPILYISI